MRRKSRRALSTDAMEKEEKSRGKEIDGCCIVFTCQTDATATWHGDWIDGWHR
jgi:hypothetical protein